MNVWDILILAAVAAMVFFGLRRIKRGDTGGCCGNCASCAADCSKKKERT